jgi:hypothetical protein
MWREIYQQLGPLLPIVLAEGAAGDREVRARKQTRRHR